jgi:hypothetical protein
MWFPRQKPTWSGCGISRPSTFTTTHALRQEGERSSRNIRDDLLAAPLPIIVMSIIWVPNRRLQGVAGADDGNRVV